MRSQDFELTYDLEIYCQSDGLLVQFILNEFSNTLLETRSLIKSYKKSEKSLLADPLSVVEEGFLEKMYPIIKKLTGHTFGQNTPLPWSTEKGHLQKLVHYSYLLASRTESVKHRELFHSMYHNVSQSFHLCMQSREYLSLTLRPKQKRSSLKELSLFFETLQAYFIQIDQASKFLYKILFTCRDDENVLYMLVSKAEHFNKAFGRKFVEKIAHKLYPGGLNELTRHIQNKYKQRGFPEVSKQINKSIKTLMPHGSKTRAP